MKVVELDDFYAEEIVYHSSRNITAVVENQSDTISDSEYDNDSNGGSVGLESGTSDSDSEESDE